MSGSEATSTLAYDVFVNDSPPQDGVLPNREPKLFSPMASTLVYGARKRTVETRDDLTAQERQIAELARDRFSNPKIGARLFPSPRTVEWHLRKVFGKLGIHSRHELAAALPGPELEPVQA